MTLQHLLLPILLGVVVAAGLTVGAQIALWRARPQGTETSVVTLFACVLIAACFYGAWWLVTELAILALGVILPPAAMQAAGEAIKWWVGGAMWLAVVVTLLVDKPLVTSIQERHETEARERQFQRLRDERLAREQLAQQQAEERARRIAAEEA